MNAAWVSQGLGIDNAVVGGMDVLAASVENEFPAGDVVGALGRIQPEAVDAEATRLEREGGLVDDTAGGEADRRRGVHVGGLPSAEFQNAANAGLYRGQIGIGDLGQALVQPFLRHGSDLVRYGHDPASGAIDRYENWGTRLRRGRKRNHDYRTAPLIQNIGG